MSFGKSGGSTQTSSSSSQSSTRPSSPQELADYFWMLDSLTGGRPARAAGQVTPSGAGGVAQPPGGLWGYGGQVYDSQGAASAARRGALDPESPVASNLLSPPAAPVAGTGATGGWTYNGQTYATQAAAEAARNADLAAGGGSPGRLATWAQQGTAPVDYQGITPAQLRAIGGAGATRELAAERAYGDQMEQYRADPRLSVAQMARANQLATRDYQGNLDAIGREVEASMTGVAQEEARRQYEAGVRNADLTARDLQALAEIFFGGRGSYSQSTEQSTGARPSGDVEFDGADIAALGKAATTALGIPWPF